MYDATKVANSNKKMVVELEKRQISKNNRLPRL